MTAKTQPLTHSEIEAYRVCPQLHAYAYAQQLAPAGEWASPLAVGRAVGAGVAHALTTAGVQLDSVIAAAGASLAVDGHACLERVALDRRDQITAQIATDGMRCATMLRGWWDAWGGSQEGLDVTRAEVTITAPLVCPDTGTPSRAYHLQGRLDGVYRVGGVGSARFGVYELKTTSDTLSEVEAYLRHGTQVALYQYLLGERLRSIGQDPREQLPTVIDAIKKPTAKRRRTGPRAESEEDYWQRCVAEYAADPQRYFLRAEIEVDPGAHDEARRQAVRVARCLRQDAQHGRLTVRGPRCKGPYGWCRYRGLCWHNRIDDYERVERGG